VEWCANQTLKFQEQVRAQYRIHVGLKHHGTATVQMHPVYLLGKGNGGYFKASELPVGTFTVNGVQFTVVDTGSSSNKKKKKKRTRTRQRPAPTVPAAEAVALVTARTAIQTKSMQSNVQKKKKQKSMKSMKNNVQKKDKQTPRTTETQEKYHMPAWGAPVVLLPSSGHASSPESMWSADVLAPQWHKVKSFTPQVFLLDEPHGEKYVTVEWCERNNYEATPPPRYMPIGARVVELFPVADGRCIFRASLLEVGNYLVDGVSFSAIRTGIPRNNSRNV
jgi:hypothetical protein